MAKTISDEQMKLSIIINGNSAQKELFDLEKSTRSLTEANKGHLLQKQLLEKQGKKDTEQYKLLTATMKQNNAEITENKNKMKLLQDQIGITGLTMKQLSDKAKILRMSLLNAVPGSEAYKKYTAELDQVNGRLSELKGKANTAKTSLGSLADGFNRYQALAFSFIAALTGMVLSVQKIIDINGKLADAQSDVMKTTGMTKKEVDELTKSFGLLETRTSRIDLLKIAEQGGRIGIAKAEIGDFVNVMNKASVSLGDSFSGGAEEVANKLGKIKFLFQETKDLKVDQAYNSIGSAINDLGANGVASEANIADFTTRIGSLTDVLKPTIQETLALGTAFEESGIESEVSARAYGIFMKQASTETAKFAKVMKITQGEVEAMINTNPLEFMLKFAQGMKGMSATDTAKTLDALGVSADGANKVIGAMGNNTARFRELIQLSNKSFANGTSLINEYNIKNENAAATLEKISKRVTGWFSSETFAKYLAGFIIWIAKFIGAAQDADGVVSKWRNAIVGFVKVLAIATIALISQRTALMVTTLITSSFTEAIALSTIAQKAWNLTTTTARFITGLFSGTLALLRIGWIWVSQGTAAATTQLQIFNITTKLNPIGAFVTLLMACVAAYVLFADKADASNEAMKAQIDIANSVTEQTSKQKQSISDLTAIMNDENATINQKKKALEQIKKISDGYLEGLSLENIATAEGTRLINRYIQSIDELAKAKAMVEIKTKLRTQILEADNKVLALSIEKKSNKNNGYAGSGDDGKIFGLGGRNKQEIQTEIADEKAKRDLLINQSNSLYSSSKKEVSKLQKNLKEQNERLKVLKKDSKEYKELVQDINSNSNTLNTLIGLQPVQEEPTGPKFDPLDNTNKGSGSKKNPNSSPEEINKLKLDEQSRFNDLFLKQQRQLEDDRIATMQDGYDKELLIENQRYKREIDDLNRQKVHADEIVKLEEDIAKAKEAKDMTKYNALLTIRKGWDKKNADLDTQINAIQEGKMEIHNSKLATIEEKGATELLKKRKEEFEQAKIIRETKFNEQLAALGNNEKAKEKLRKNFALSELAEEEKFLKELIDQFKIIIGKGNFGKMDMSLLTPEQVESFTKEAAKVGLTLSELIAKKNELTGKEAVGDAAALGISKSNTDIFGFTPENWVQFSDNLAMGKVGINEMVFAVTALTDAYSKYNEFLTANENAQLKKYTAASDAKKTKLKKQLDSGMISQTQYNKSVEKIDEDLDNKKADLEYKQAKRQRMISAAQIVMSTAQAIIGIWAQFPKFDFGATAAIMSGVVGALGALQLATVLSTPLPAKGHEAGLYPEYVKREQDGKMFKSKYQGKTRSGLVSNTSHFLVAENGPEMVIDNKAWTQMDPNVKDALVRDLRGIKGFEQGYYNQDLKRYEVPTATTSSSNLASNGNNDQMMQMVLAVVAENTAVMKDLRDKGVVGKFFKNDLKSAENIQDSIKDFNNLRNKAKN